MFWRPKPKAQDAQLEILAKHIHGLGLRMQALEEKHLALAAAHERLRGRFYQRIGPESREVASKAEILREFGFRPGQPVPHK